MIEPDLRPVDLELLRRLALGLSGPRLGAELGCSPATARRRVRRLRARLGARTDVHAVVLALRRGLL